MKIAFCTPGGLDHEDYAKGDLLGTEHQVFGLAKELAQAGNEVIIFRRWYGPCPADEVQGIKIVNIASPDLPDARVMKIVTKLIFSLYTRKLIGAYRPDVLVLTDIFSSRFVSGVDIPKIYVTHNPPSMAAKKASPPGQIIKELTERAVFGNVDCIVALNSFIKEKLENHGYQSVVIPNAIENAGGESREDGMYVLFCGRFARIKGLEVLITAYAGLSRDIRDQYKLVLAGEGPEMDDLSSIVNKLGIDDRVIFLPWQLKPEMMKLVSACTVFVLPSRAETFSVVAIEVMGRGKPVIASNIPGPGDIIRHGHDGLLFETGNADKLRACLERCLKDRILRERLGRNALLTVSRRFLFSRTSGEYMKIFATIAGKADAPH